MKNNERADKKTCGRNRQQERQPNRYRETKISPAPQGSKRNDCIDELPPAFSDTRMLIDLDILFPKVPVLVGPVLVLMNNRHLPGIILKRRDGHSRHQLPEHHSKGIDRGGIG